MTDIDKGDEAFPCPSFIQLGDAGLDMGEISHSGGMTKREYFAARAMQGILSGEWKNHNTSPTRFQIAEISVKIADALIEELNKETK